LRALARRVLLTTAAIATLSLACAKREDPAPPALRWEMRDLQRSWSADTDTTSEVWVSLHYPEFLSVAGDSTALDSLNRWVKRTLVAASMTDSTPGDLEALAAQMIANYQDVRERFGTPPAPWFYENEIRVTWDTLDVVSMVSSADSYTGGAHGAAITVWVVIDANRGRRLFLGDLITPAARDTLLILGEAAFRRARGLQPELPLNQQGFWFPDDRFRLTPNFGIERKGLAFHYNSGDVGPFASGPTSFTIPWDEIAGYIRPDAPMRFLRPPS